MNGSQNLDDTGELGLDSRCFDGIRPDASPKNSRNFSFINDQRRDIHVERPVREIVVVVLLGLGLFVPLFFGLWLFTGWAEGIVLQEVRREGERAHMAGLNHWDNPHIHGPKRAAWLNGWVSARLQEKEIDPILARMMDDLLPGFRAKKLLAP